MRLRNVYDLELRLRQDPTELGKRDRVLSRPDRGPLLRERERDF